MTREKRVVLCSPTERGEHMSVLRRMMLPQLSAMPEKRGVDFLWTANGEWWGVQRKTIADLWASVEDGRLNVELGQISTELQHAVFMIEGKLHATVDGMFTAGHKTLAVSSHYKALMTLASHDITVLQTESAQHTGFAIKALVEWTREGGHGVGATRPKAVGKWGKATSREWGMHFLQGFNGIGPEVASAIVDAHGVPLAWTITPAELLAVPGVGRVRCTELIEALK